MKNNIYALFLLISVFISSISQVLLKKSANKKYSSIIKEYLNFHVISAYILFFIAVFIDLYALNYVPLSFVPVIETSSYFFIILLSRIIFKEKITWLKSIAISLILIGIFIYVF